MIWKDLWKQEFAGNLRREMEARGLTQADLARESGLSPALIYKYYHGKSLPGPSKADRLAEALDTYKEELLPDGAPGSRRYSPDSDRLLHAQMEGDSGLYERMKRDRRVLSSYKKWQSTMHSLFMEILKPGTTSSLIEFLYDTLNEDERRRVDLILFNPIRLQGMWGGEKKRE